MKKNQKRKQTNKEEGVAKKQEVVNMGMKMDV